MQPVVMCWRSADGEEREEAWPSIEAFLMWARAEGLRAAWRAYGEPDADGERPMLDEGRV
jgi:hypothetical protein